MNLSKSLEAFDPSKAKHRVLIIGCGATGSSVSLQLARLGVTKLVVFDDDIVESKNVNNQNFNLSQVGMKKVDALKQILVAINPDIEEDGIFISEKFVSKKILEPTVAFVCLDKGREQVFKHLSKQIHVKLLIETRIGLNDGVVYTVEPEEYERYKLYIPSIERENTVDKTEMSPCGESLSVKATVDMTACVAVQNYRAYVNEAQYKNEIIFSSYPTLTVMSEKW